MTDRKLEREKEFFDRTFEKGVRQPLSKFYTITARSREYYKTLLLTDCSRRMILECGCGKGSYAFPLAQHGAVVVGIDISEVAVRLAERQAEKEGLANISFEVMDAEHTRFQDNTFDKICGTGILHHLNMDKVIREIVRILKPEGQAVFKEPLGHNLFINAFRRLTPHMRTEDEHPLLNKDLRQIKRFFEHHDYQFFHFLSLAAVPFRNVRIFFPLLEVLDFMDDKLLSWFPFLKPWAWQVILVLEKPRKSRIINESRQGS